MDNIVIVGNSHYYCDIICYHFYYTDLILELEVDVVLIRKEKHIVSNAKKTGGMAQVIRKSLLFSSTNDNTKDIYNNFVKILL